MLEETKDLYYRLNENGVPEAIHDSEEIRDLIMDVESRTLFDATYGKTRITTTFTVYDRSVGFSIHPALFETRTHYLDTDVTKYTYSLKQAKRAHERAVVKAMKTVDQMAPKPLLTNIMESVSSVLAPRTNR